MLLAAREVFVRFGLRRTTMEDVARAADLGRATVYRKFASKEALVEAVMLAELKGYLDELDRLDEQIPDFAERMVEGFVTTLRYVREHSLLASVIELDGEWGLAYFAANSAGLIAAARGFVASKMRAGHRAGAVDDTTIEQVAELVVRVCHSLMITPTGVIPYGDEDAARAFARDVLVPIVARR